MVAEVFMELNRVGLVFFVDNLEIGQNMWHSQQPAAHKMFKELIINECEREL